MQIQKYRFAVIISTMLFSLLAASSATAAQVARCKLGVYVTSLHDVDTVKQTFSADAWIWTVCPDKKVQPLQTAEFTTANSFTGMLDSTIARPGLSWSQRKISGTFRASFDLTNFPFERHKLIIGIEEGVQDINGFEYELDALNSGINSSIKVPQWNIDGFSAFSRRALYETNFGDPLMAPRTKSEYSHIDFVIDISRSERTSFFKLAVPAYAAVLLALFSLLMHIEDGGNLLNPRIGLLAGSLFAVVFNLRSVDDVVGSTPATTALDLIHFSALALIIGTTLFSVLSSYFVEAGMPLRKIRKLDYGALIVSGAVFTLINIYVVHSAMKHA